MRSCSRRLRDEPSNRRAWLLCHKELLSAAAVNSVHLLKAWSPVVTREFPECSKRLVCSVERTQLLVGVGGVLVRFASKAGEVFSMPLAGGTATPVVTGFVAPTVGLGEHAGSLYVGRVFKVTPWRRTAPVIGSPPFPGAERA
jgi:hypothetical protein